MISQKCYGLANPIGHCIHCVHCVRYPFSPFCPDHTLDCITSPAAALAKLNDGPAGQQWTRTAAGCDLFFQNKTGFEEALNLAKEADYVVLGLGIETCGMDPAHNLNPKAHGGKLGSCYQVGGILSWLC